MTDTNHQEDTSTSLTDHQKSNAQSLDPAHANQSQVTIPFFAISAKRLVLLSILTVGLYIIYWFYKNWMAVKKAENSKIWPFWRAIFSIFFAYSLFKRINFAIQDQPNKQQFHPGLWAFLYIAFSMLQNLGLVFFNIIPLIFAQRAINFNNKQIDPAYKTAKTFTTGEKILVGLGIVLWILGGWSVWNNASKKQAPVTSWQIFRSPTGEFEAYFPKEPQHKQEEIPLTEKTIPAQMHTYECIANYGMHYSISQVTYPADAKIADIALKQWVDDLVQSSKNNQLVSSHPTAMGQYPAMDFAIKNGGVRLKGRVFVAENTRYLLVTSYADREYSETYYNHFINAFKLLA